jgi:23S rRNA (pseudouridine1915-N3)-methyltransferase
VRTVLVCVGRIRKPFADDVAHYERLLGRRWGLKTVELKEAGADSARRRLALEKEAAALLGRLPGQAYVCALDREGEALSSPQIARFMDERRSGGRDLWFVIGGPFGLHSSVLERADSRLSLGPVTFPHQLARVILLEQLFRAQKILAREPYHY